MTREEAIERIRDHMIVHKMNEPRAIYITEALKMAIEALNQPEIIRCKDCKWKSRDVDFRNLKCPWGERVEMTDNDFCSRYERR